MEEEIVLFLLAFLHQNINYLISIEDQKNSEQIEGFKNFLFKEIEECINFFKVKPILDT